MIQAATNATKITHTHKLGVHGALLQSIAIHQSLHLDPEEKVDVQHFATQLIDKMKDLEKTSDDDLQ